MADRVSTAAAEAAAIAQSKKFDEAYFVLDCVEKSSSHRAPFKDVWEESLQNYLVAPTNTREAIPRIGNLSTSTATSLRSGPRVQSKLKNPKTNEIIDTMAAQGIALLMPNMDYIQAIPIGFDDPDKARYLSRLLMGILTAPGVYKTHFTTFKDAFIFGTAILEIGWETKSRLQRVKNPKIDKKMGVITGWQYENAEVVYRDAPLIRQVDIFDFYPDPSGTRIHEDMVWVVKRFRITRQQALAMAEAGIYSKEETRLATRSKGTNDQRSDVDKRFPEMETDTHEDYGMVTGFEFWGEVPWKPADGARNRVITILNGQHVRSSINPFIDGEIPFKEVILNPIAGRFYGLAPAEVIRYLQDAADTFLMGTTDSMSRSIKDVLLVGSGFQGDPSRLQRRIPGDVIPCGNPEAIKPLETNLNALQMGAQQMLQLEHQMTTTTGVSSPLTAANVGDRATATQISEITRISSQRVELMVQFVERDDYPWIGRTLHSRIKQFLDTERQAVLAGERFPVTLDDVDFDADIRFVGSRQAQSKFQTAVQMREALKVLSDPNLVRLQPDLITRYLRDGLDIKDAEEIVKKALATATQMQQEQMMMEQQQQSASTMNSDDTLGTEAFAPSMEGQRVA